MGKNTVQIIPLQKNENDSKHRKNREQGSGKKQGYGKAAREIEEI